MIDPKWNEIFSSREWGGYPDTDLIRFMAAHFYDSKCRKDLSVLEVGCGPGANLRYLAEQGFGIFGVDGSPKAIEHAKSYLSQYFKSGSFNHLLVGDIASMQFMDATFDAVIDIESVYANSVEDSLIIYKEILRVLKPGGRLFVKTFAPGTHDSIFPEGTFYRVSDISQMNMLLEDFKIENLDVLSRTANNTKTFIREWLITARKPDATG